MIKIEGKNSFDTDMRIEALEVLNTLPTEVLSRLVELSQSNKALGYLNSKSGFSTVKAFLGIK